MIGRFFYKKTATAGIRQASGRSPFVERSAPQAQRRTDTDRPPVLANLNTSETPP
jgi:hypothetical protein